MRIPNSMPKRLAAWWLFSSCFALGVAPVALAGGGHGHHGGHDEHKEEEPKGVHGGKLLNAADGFTLEVTIYEPGIPPQSRVYPYFEGQPISPREVDLKLELHRFDRVDRLSYRQEGDFLFGDQIVAEPHSFDVKVKAKFRGESYEWSYESHEGRVEISKESAALSGIGLSEVQGHRFIKTVPVIGDVRLNEERIAVIAPEYTGRVTSLRRGLGDYIRAGEGVATIMGAETLSSYTVTAPISGRVIEKNIRQGEMADVGQSLLVVADTRSVWVDFAVYPDDRPQIKVGQTVNITVNGSEETLTGKISYLDPMGDPHSQSISARAVIDNEKGLLTPGLRVVGAIEIGVVDAKTAVKKEAIQTFRDWQVVFRNRGELYEIAVVELGVEDDEYIEVISGLDVGVSYVSENSFIVKADVGKAGASHDH